MFAIREKLEDFAFFAPGAAILNLEKKNDRNSFHWVFDDLSIVTCCMSLRRSGADFKGNNPPSSFFRKHCQ